MDRLNTMSARMLAEVRAGLVPCTFTNVIKLFRHTEHQLKDGRAVVLGVSRLVGPALAQTPLAAKRMRMTHCHSRAATCPASARKPQHPRGDDAGAPRRPWHRTWRLRGRMHDRDIEPNRTPDGLIAATWTSPPSRRRRAPSRPWPEHQTDATIAMLLSNTVEGEPPSGLLTVRRAETGPLAPGQAIQVASMDSSGLRVGQLRDRGLRRRAHPRPVGP